MAIVKKNKIEKKNKNNDEKADKSKKGSSLEDEGSEEQKKKGEGELDPADSFSLQDYDMTSVEEGRGQSHTTKELDKLREVETAQKADPQRSWTSWMRGKT